jgi:hypothetical protein
MTVDKVLINPSGCFRSGSGGWGGGGDGTRHVMSGTTSPSPLHMQMETCRSKLIKMKMGFRPIRKIITDRSTLM